MLQDDILSANPDAEILANQELPSEDKPSAEQPTEQPIVPQPEPAWKAKYKSPDDMWDENRKFMSEKQKLENENQRLRQQIPQPPLVDQAVARDKRLEQFIQDPDAVINEAASKMVLPLQAKIILMDFEEQHPEARAYRSAMRDIVNESPSLLQSEYGLEAAYLLAKERDITGKQGQAQKMVVGNRAAIQESKKTDAYVEPATQPKRSASPTLKQGMSIAESQKALDAAGIGWNPEDRISGD
jgi:hypothetical protein